MSGPVPMHLRESRSGPSGPTRWTPVRFVERRKDRPRWLMRCSCGTEKVVDWGSYRNGTSRSCGCYNREITRSRPGVGKKPHGASARNHLFLSTERARPIAAYRSTFRESKWRSSPRRIAPTAGARRPGCSTEAVTPAAAPIHTMALTELTRRSDIQPTMSRRVAVSATTQKARSVEKLS